MVILQIIFLISLLSSSFVAAVEVPESLIKYESEALVIALRNTFMPRLHGSDSEMFVTMVEDAFPDAGVPMGFGGSKSGRVLVNDFVICLRRLYLLCVRLLQEYLQICGLFKPEFTWLLRFLTSFLQNVYKPFGVKMHTLSQLLRAQTGQTRWHL